MNVAAAEADDSGLGAPTVGTAELAAWLGIREDSVRRMHARGDGPPGVLLGNRMRYRVADVEAWWRARCGSASTAAA